MSKNSTVIPGSQPATVPGAERIALPQFDPVTVTDFLRDGYWLEALDVTGSGTPDLVGHGLTAGELYWYENPGWRKRLLLDGITEPVGGDSGQITGHHGDDYVVSYQLYGPGGTIHHADPEGGKIDWLENPGPEAALRGDRWARHPVGRAVGMHRLRLGHFTRGDRVQILGFPIVTVQSVHSVLPIVLFTEPEDLLGTAEWEREVISDNRFRMIHGVALRPGIAPGTYDQILMASDEGVTRLYFDAGQWIFERVGDGEQSQFEVTNFRGSGDLDGGRVGGDPLAYVAAIEPFHGNTVSVYVRDPRASGGWRRFVLDTFGEPNENGESPGHSVITADFDGDGDDEFLIGLRGSSPWQGVFYYKAIDLARGIFVKWRVGEESVARIVVADFDDSGRPDFATIAYSVEHYFVARRAGITLHVNGTDVARES
ncbi:VCBS repeat-containing protein [Mycetocola saprophilus]|uniref:VCBS repeat-containing protein n=1 Tax=Mycetocola saprophilus TaxID=76636 RepID=UPI003BF0E05A